MAPQKRARERKLFRKSSRNRLMSLLTLEWISFFARILSMQKRWSGPLKNARRQSFLLEQTCALDLKVISMGCRLQSALLGWLVLGLILLVLTAILTHLSLWRHSRR